LKKWLNDVYLSKGVAMPYSLDEFDSEIAFEHQRMHVFLEANSKASQFLEEEWW